MTAADQLREEGQLREKINMAIKCLQRGADVKFIAEVTDLPIEKINALAKEHQLH